MEETLIYRDYPTGIYEARVQHQTRALASSGLTYYSDDASSSLYVR